MNYYETKDGKLPHLALPDDYVKHMGTYWRPNAAFLEELADFLRGRKVLEVCAGNGLLAAHLAARGISVTATTILSGHDRHEFGIYHAVTELDAVSAVEDLGDAHDVLLVCWPLPTPAVLRAAARWGSDRDIVYIGEVTDYTRHHLAGCATDQFFEHISVGRLFHTYKTTNEMESAFACRFRDERHPLPGKDAD